MITSKVYTGKYHRPDCLLGVRKGGGDSRHTVFACDLSQSSQQQVMTVITFEKHINLSGAQCTGMHVLQEHLSVLVVHASTLV